MIFLWPVVPLCEAQLKDVREEDILHHGAFRKCDTYRGGGGYDRFPYIFEARYGEKPHVQFVVQLQGCHLSCPYCYVTPEGIKSEPILFTKEELVDRYVQSGLPIFHLMGGAPGLYLDKWPELIDELFRQKPDAIFHSDLLLTEQIYSHKTLKLLKRDRCLYAISIKGTEPLSYAHNTGLKYLRALQHDKLLYLNVKRVLRCLPTMYFYFTFTNCTEREIYTFKKTINDEAAFENSFSIDLVKYKALEE